MATKDLLDLTRKERAARTYQRTVYHTLVNLRRAIFDAARANVDIGDLATLDTDHFLVQIKKVAGINYGSDWEKKQLVERPDVVPLETVKTVDFNPAEKVDF